jgi:alginate O-acetyltransferase complex protein AlgI
MKKRLGSTTSQKPHCRRCAVRYRGGTSFDELQLVAPMCYRPAATAVAGRTAGHGRGCAKSDEVWGKAELENWVYAHISATQRIIPPSPPTKASKPIQQTVLHLGTILARPFPARGWLRCGPVWLYLHCFSLIRLRPYLDPRGSVLFNSYEFIFAFLPVTLAVYFLIGRSANTRLAFGWLLLASLFFYAYWNPANLAIIIVSVCFNFWLGRHVIHVAHPSRRKLHLGLGIAANLALLGYFKYANFFVSNWNALGGPTLYLHHIVLPIAISFFTFQQIVFLVEAYRGEAGDYDFLHYALLVTFFPHLIAGPIVHYREMLQQFNRPSVSRFQSSHFAVGLTIFSIGLFKKVVFADSVAPVANAVYGAAKTGMPLTFAEAWVGALAYTFQLYFDFSGYSDMAIGLARMVGIRFPMNFDSPYKSVNIIDFWRRWHITLSRFLRDYLYIPLGGNRKGPVRRYANLFLTMLLGGLWHGAGWTFVVWGGLHGFYLMVNHGWHAMRKAVGLEGSSPVGRGVARAVTFLAAVVAWVFFRAESFPAAMTVLRSMFLGNGISFPKNSGLAHAMPHALVSLGGIKFDGVFHNALIEPGPALRWVALLALIAWFGPNTQEIMSRYRPALGFSAEGRVATRSRWLLWRPNLVWSVLAALAAVAALINLWIGSNAEFIYFQF